MTTRTVIVYIVLLLVRLCHAKLNILTMTSGSVPSIGTISIQPTYLVALEDMALKYPALYDNFTMQDVSIALDLNPCEADHDQVALVEFVKVLYGDRLLQAKPNEPIVILNSRKTENVLDSIRNISNSILLNPVIILWKKSKGINYHCLVFS